MSPDKKQSRGSPCPVAFCKKELHPGMGPWVPFCEVHWRVLPQTLRMDVFDKYRSIDPLRAEYTSAVRDALAILLNENIRRRVAEYDELLSSVDCDDLESCGR